MMLFEPLNAIVEHSDTTKSSASVGYERVPITLSTQKSKLQLEYLEITTEIMEIIKVIRVEEENI